MSGSPYPPSCIRDDDAVYARSPVTAAEEAAQYLPGSRFLNMTEFKRVYLGDAKTGGATDGFHPLSAASATANEQEQQYYSGSRAAQQQQRVATSLNTAVVMPHNVSRHSGRNNHASRNHPNVNGLVPRRPPSASVLLPRTRDGKAVQLCFGENNTSGAAAAFPSSSSTAARYTHSSQAAPGSSRTVLDPTSGQRQAGMTRSGARSPLSHRLRCEVRAARLSPSAGPGANALSPTGARPSTVTRDRALRSEDAWLSLQRELTDRKDEVRSLQRQLRRAQVLVRTLHGVASDGVGGADEYENEWLNENDAKGIDRAAALNESGGERTESAEATTADEPRPKEYWQRRAYFLEKQQEELTAEVEQLRSDARGRKVRALLQELDVMKGQLERYRRRQQRPCQRSGPVTVQMSSDAMTSDNAVETTRQSRLDDIAAINESNEEEGEEAAGVASGPVGKRWATQRDPVIAAPSAIDEFYLSQKEELIRDLRERLRLLTQQYQRADAQLIASTRQLEDLTHRYNAMQAEWRALQPLPQELARLQQQLSTTHAQLLESDREVESFHQLFDTLQSPATLRAVVEERDHLIELLRQSQQQQVCIRDEMKVSQQQVVQAVEAKYCAQLDEEHAMARDREAQQVQTIRKLRKQVESLERQLETQREAYEALLAESANEHEVDLTERLLESAAHGGVEEANNNNNNSAGASVNGSGGGGSGVSGTSSNETATLHKTLPSERGGSTSCSPPRSLSLSSRPRSCDGPRNAPAPRSATDNKISTTTVSVAADAAVNSTDSTSESLDTESSVYKSVDALVRNSEVSSATGASSSLEVGKAKDVTASAYVRKTTTLLTAVHEEDSINSSLTPTSDTANSSTDETLTESEDDNEDENREEKDAQKDEQNTLAAVTRSTPSNLSSREVLANTPATTASNRQHGSDVASTNGASIVVHQEELVSLSEEDEGDELTDNDDAVTSYSTSNIGASNSDGNNSNSSNTARDDGHRLDKTIEKAVGSTSASSSDSSLPTHESSVLRIGFGYSKSQGAASTAVPEAKNDFAATASLCQRGRFFDFPAPPIAIVHPVSILINRTSNDGLRFVSDLHAVVHSPSTSPQQTTTTASDPTQSQLTLTDSNSEDGSSSSLSSSSSCSATDTSVAAARLSAPTVHEQKETESETAAINIANNNEEGNTEAVSNTATEGPLTGAAAAVTLRATSQSRTGTIHPGSQSALDGIIRPMLPIQMKGSPVETRPTQLAESLLSVAAAFAAAGAGAVPVTAAAAPLMQSPGHAGASSAAATATVAPSATQVYPLARATVHTPPHPNDAPSSLHNSITNLPCAASNKAAPIPSPPAITPLITSSLYPPRTISTHLLPSFTLEDSNTAGGVGESGGGGPPRGGASPRLQSANHSSVDLTHQFSGNASFDFVGPLAERHRLEDMQNNIVLSQQTSPATLPSGAGVTGAAAASLFPSAVPSLNASHASMSAGAAGLRKTPSPPLMPEARRQSSVVLSTIPINISRSGSGDADSKSTAEEKQKEEVTAPAEQKSALPPPSLAATASEEPVAQGGFVQEVVTVFSVDGPAHAEAEEFGDLQQAHTPSTGVHCNGTNGGVPVVELLQPVVSSLSSKDSDVSLSPIPKTLPQEGTLSPFAVDDVGGMRATPQASEEVGPDASEGTSQLQPLPAATAAELKSLEPPHADVTQEDTKPGDTVNLSVTALAGASLLPLPSLVKALVPPSASAPPHPSGTVPPPSEAAGLLPPHIAIPLPPPSLPRSANVEDNIPGNVSAAAVRSAEAVLSMHSTPEDEHTLSGADLMEEENDDVDDDGDDTFSSTPPAVVGGTVEKTRSPPEVRLPSEFSLQGPHHVPSPQIEATALRYSASAASSVLVEPK